MSSETLSLQNARIVLNSLKTETPLYLGSRFTIETDPNKREEFHKLISALDPKDPDFKKTTLALKLIATKQDPCSLSCFENIHAAVSSVLPISKIPEPKMLQNDLSTVLLALELAVSMFNVACIDKIQDDLTREENLSGSLVRIGKWGGFEAPSMESLESFALFLRWVNFSRESTEGRLFKLNTSSQNNISELIQLKQYSIDQETKKLAGFIYFSIQMNKLSKMDEQEARKLDLYSKEAKEIANQYLKKYNPSLLDRSLVFSSSNKEHLKNLSKLLSDETIFADYKTKYNRLKALREKSSKKVEFTATYFHLVASCGFHTSDKFPFPEELGKWVFENLLFDPIAKIADEEFIQFIQKKSGIDCYSFFTPLEKLPAPLQALPAMTSSSSTPIQNPSVPSPSPEIFAPSKIVEACSIHSIFNRQSVQKHFPYHERVLAWFEDPSIPLSADKYRSLNPALQQEITWKHSFPKLVDSFVGTEYCLQGQWQNKNVLYFIPGEIEREGRKFRGGFQYAFLPDGSCYHRCWGEKSNDELIDQLMNQTIWNEIDFPPLEEALKPASKPKPEMIDSYPVELNPRSGMATFRDGNTKITLFKIGLEL